MISSETPYKLAEVIRDTWPGLYRYESQKTEKAIEPKKINKQNNNNRLKNEFENCSDRCK
jgi:hypothetical protein